MILDEVGGPITDLGAQRIVDKTQFLDTVAGAIRDAQGDIDKAAEQLGIGRSTLYGYIEDEHMLGDAFKTSQKSSDSEDK